MTYTLTADGPEAPDDATLRIDFEAVTDAPTLVNLTNHTYFNLSGSASTPFEAPGRPIDGHRLQVHADYYVPVSSHGIPTGRPKRVAHTRMDLRQATELGVREIDHALMLYGARTAEEVAAVLSHPGTGRQVTVRTAKPALQVYTGEHLAAPWSARSGIALEPEFPPDSPNQYDFPSAVLRPGERYHHTTSLTFANSAT